MYIPEQFTEENFERITGLIKSNPFGMLITMQDNSPFVSHLPFLFDSCFGTHGKLIAHMAKENPQWHSLISSESVLVVFNGAHGYISPTWYSNSGVPTWNYAVVHLHGNPTLIEDSAELEDILVKLTDEFESKNQNSWKLNLSEEKKEKKEKLLKMIVGFEIKIHKIEGKFKLSQNRSPQDQQNVINELGKSAQCGDIELSKFMESYFAADSQKPHGM